MCVWHGWWVWVGNGPQTHRPCTAEKITPNIKWFCLTYFVIKCGNVHISLGGTFPSGVAELRSTDLVFTPCRTPFGAPAPFAVRACSKFPFAIFQDEAGRQPGRQVLAYFTWTLCSVNFLNYWPRLCIHCNLPQTSPSAVAVFPGALENYVFASS